MYTVLTFIIYGTEIFMDLTSLGTIKYIKDKYGFNMSKGLGQNFLLDSGALEEIASSAELSSESGVLEIGPGIGVLTKRLAQSAKKVVSIEIDARLLDVLDETLAEYDNVKIISGDVMKTDLQKLIADEFGECNEVSVAANLPYYITTPILTRLLEDSGLNVKNIVVMVQKEVAQRLCAEPKTKNYSALSVLVAYHADAEITVHVPASSFAPPPKVDSAVVRLKMRTQPPVTPKSEKIFFKTVRAAFGQRRKTLVNALCGSSAFPLTKERFKQIISELGLGENVRGEELGLDRFCALADAIYDDINQ